MKDQSFVIYSQRYVYLGGSIENGRLKLVSEVYGGSDSYDSEQHISLGKKETEKLFSICTLEELIALGRWEHYSGLIRFLNENGIRYLCTGY